MKNVNKFTVVAILFALFLTNSVLGDSVPVEGRWEDEYYRSADAPLPPVASIERDILSLGFGDALSNLTICAVNDRGVKIYEDVVSSEAGGTYSSSLAGEINGQCQVVLLHQLGYLTDNLILE